MRGAKVDNVSAEICRHPCEELIDLLTEIQGLRIVTNNLLEDLERVVRQIQIQILVRVLSVCCLCFGVFSSACTIRLDIKQKLL